VVGNQAAAQVDDWLAVEHETVLSQRHANPLNLGQRPGGPSAEHACLITAMLLGFILGYVCRDQSIVGGELLLRRKQADPNARLDRLTRSLA
jgi:hypothetical protein